MADDDTLAAHYAHIPEDTNVIVSHGPPKGYGDRIYWDGQHQNVGSKALLGAVMTRPGVRYVVCGHIHEAAGFYPLPASTTTVVNCSQVNEDYEPVFNAVRVLDL